MSNPTNNSPDITRRMPEPSVTRRMESGSDNHDGITRRMLGASTTTIPAAASLKLDEFVDDRYRVIEGPLGEQTGEAEVYRCHDEEMDQQVALKLYILDAQPKEKVLEELRHLSHPDIVRLLDWNRWQGRFYEVMEFCKGGTLIDGSVPFSEENLTKILREVVGGLQYLHRRGIVHRDIKPTNLFYRDTERTDVVIGDFGISSFLGAGISAGKTSTFHRVTFLFAAPEMLDDEGDISPKTDYYALGITLAWLVSGRSPFVHPDGRAMNPNKVGELKSRNEIPTPSGSSPKLAQLIRGLTRFKAHARWGDVQVLQWLNGEEIRGEDGRPDAEHDMRETAAPYPDCPSITNPLVMAARLHEFNAVEGLFRGWIGSWVHTHFSAELAKEVADIQDNFSKDRDLGLLKLRYTLDPRLPLDVGSGLIYSLDELAHAIGEALRCGTPSRTALEEALYKRRIECWIDATQDHLATKSELTHAVVTLRERLQTHHLGLFALFYTLQPQAALYLTEDAAVESLDLLEDVLTQHPDAEPRVEDFLYDGRIAEWLRATRGDDRDMLDFVEDCVLTHPKDRSMGATAFRWHCRPTLPFPFVPHEAGDARELATLINASAESFERGSRLLRDGWIRAWLTSTGRMPDTAAFDAIIAYEDASWGRKMQEVLQLLVRNIPGPQPIAEPPILNLGYITTEAESTVHVTITNGGRGFLCGSVQLAALDGGFAIRGTPTIEGSPITVEITIKPEGLPAGSRQATTLVAETNGGTLRVPIRYKVGMPWFRMISRSLGMGVIWAVALGGIRLLISTTMPVYANDGLGWISFQEIAPRGLSPETFQFVPDHLFFLLTGILLIGSAVGWIYWIVKMNRTNKE